MAPVISKECSNVSMLHHEIASRCTSCGHCSGDHPANRITDVLRCYSVTTLYQNSDHLVSTHHRGGRSPIGPSGALLGVQVFETTFQGVTVPNPATRTTHVTKGQNPFQGRDGGASCPPSGRTSSAVKQPDRADRALLGSGGGRVGVAWPMLLRTPPSMSTARSKWLRTTMLRTLSTPPRTWSSTRSWGHDRWAAPKRKLNQLRKRKTSFHISRVFPYDSAPGATDCQSWLL